MGVKEHQYQVYQHIDQLVHELFHVFDVYVLYNHGNSYKLNDKFDIENSFELVELMMMNKMKMMEELELNLFVLLD
jgi:hypothetical protein